MTRDVFVLVESNTTGTGRLFPVAARALGLHPVLLAADPSRYASVGGAEVVRTDTDSVAAVVDACRRLAVGRRVAGVATSSDYYVETAAAAAVALGLPANSPADLAAIRDKGTQRARLAAAGVRVPRFTVAGTVDEVLAAAAATGYPVVVKPVTGSGSLGVLLCADAERAAGHARALLSRENDERGRPVPHRVTVEEFVSGPEYSAEVLDGTVAGITAKHLGAPPLFVETGHDFPADLAPAVREAVTEAAEAAVRALGIALGPAHVELRLGPAGPVLIEVNPRLAGGWIPRLVREATGADLILGTVAAFSGRPAPVAATAARGAAIRFVMAAGDGRLRGIDGVARACAVPGVVDVETYREPGAEIVVGGDFRDRIGHVLARGATAAEAAAGAEEGVGRITLSMTVRQEVSA
ncbi:ATP-grasp domain-containing protein [Streptomyces sp. LP11]|uniref:ATP-grasp domain-containing protein n=1 Tax=Streptomyces pyxinicus TaxID=2970331 RepID=A0ABT2AX95_9ACTN|nr:ATP-grasp domain-containing protein [Streptomyces sp. LP11]MCS0600872.1 ATP-grasp domain-containing protein [Streptomyces sp. LP11]